MADKEQRNGWNTSHLDFGSPSMVCVDGSGIHPKDSLLRTVAWATALHDELAGTLLLALFPELRLSCAVKPWQFSWLSRP